MPFRWYNRNMGYVDIYDSRRTAFERCAWWSKRLAIGQTGNIDYSRLAHDAEPSGYFYAEETNDPTETPMAIGGVRATARNVTISTTDDVYGLISKDDLVKYGGRIWRVESISLKREWRRSQFSKRNNEGTKIIVLRS